MRTCTILFFTAVSYDRKVFIAPTQVYFFPHILSDIYGNVLIVIYFGDFFFQIDLSRTGGALERKATSSFAKQYSHR